MNAELTRAHGRLLPWFQQLPRERHPWWWPAGAGTATTDWGVPDGEGLAASLGVRATSAAGIDVGGCGSVSGERREAGTRGVLYWVLLDAPPACGEDIAALDEVPRWVRALGIAGCTHVTSVRKFRPDPQGTPLPDAAILDAATVLADEARAVPPLRVFAGHNARRTLRAVLDVLRDRDEAGASVVQALIGVHGREGRMPHARSGRTASMDEATVLLDAWRMALVRP